MDIEYELRGIRFRWNESKAKLNIKNHQVAFENAAQVFFDPLVQYQDASRFGTSCCDCKIGYSVA